MDRFSTNNATFFHNKKSFDVNCGLNKFEIKKLWTKQYFGWFSVIFIVYFLSAHFGLLFPIDNIGTPAICFAAGIAFLAIYSFGYRIWPSIFLGAFIVYFAQSEIYFEFITSIDQLFYVLINASAITIAPVISVYIIRKFIGFKPLFSSLRSTLSFIILLAFFVSLLSASFRTVILNKINNGQNYIYEMLLNQWLSEASGLLMVVPLVLSWRKPKFSLSIIYTPSFLLHFILFVSIIGLFYFDVGLPTVYLIFPVFIYLVYKIGRFFNLSLALLISLISIRSVTYSNVPWLISNPNESIFYIRLFLFALVLSILIVSAIFDEQLLLGKQLQLYKKIFDNSDDAISITDSKGYYIEQNRAHEKLLGYTNTELENQTPGIHLGKEVNENINAELSERQSSVGEWISNSKSGKQPIEVSAYSILNDENEIICHIATSRDISKRKEFEDLLQKSESEASSLFKDAAIPIMIEDFSAIKTYIDNLIVAGLEDWEGYFIQNPEEINKLAKMIRVLDVNKRMVELYGEGSKEKLIENLSSFFTKESLEVFKKEIIELARGKFTFSSEIPIQNFQGREIHLILSLSIPPPYREKFDRVLVSFVDITKNKRDEKIQQTLLNISNAANKAKDVEEIIQTVGSELSSIIDVSNFYMALYDSESDEITLPFVRDMKGLPQKFPVGKNLISLVIRNQFALLIDEKEMRKMEEEGTIEQIKIPSKIWLGVPLKIKGEVIGAFVLQSYTNEQAYTQKDKETLEIIANQVALSLDRKKAEVDVLQALNKAQESDRIKSAFLASMSHELRTPLNAIIGFSNLIDMDLEMSHEQILQLTAMIHKSGTNLLQIVDSIFEVSLFHKGGVKVVNEIVSLEKLLSDIYETIILRQQMQNKTEIEIMKIDNCSVKHNVYTDGEKIKHIFLHLLSNALKFTNGGTIKFGLDKIDENEAYHFYVSDTGIGIPKEKQAFIFDRFRMVDDTDSRQYEGMGIGLFICKNLIETLEGSIEVNSVVNSGSRFSFYLPLQKKE